MRMNRWRQFACLCAMTGLVGGWTAIHAVAAEDSPPAAPAKEIPVSKAMREVLEKIDSAGAYAVPKVDLLEQDNYGSTTLELSPFRHVAPYKQHFLEQMEYTGPGRAIGEPEAVQTVKVGFIGPIESTVSVATGGASHEEPLGMMMLKGAQMAVEEANAQGGYLKRSVPFELVVKNDNGLWGASGNTIVDFVYKDEVWAILGTIDGANSHIAIRVALKAEIAMMNSGDTDPTFIETNIPWVFRNIGDDRQMGYLLVDYLYRSLDYQRVGIIRSSNRYGRFGVREVRDGSRRLGRPIPIEMAYDLGLEDFSLQLERLKQANVEAVVHWGNAREGALILNQMRAMGMEQPFFACDRCLADEFTELAGENAENVVCLSPWDPTRDDPRYQEFRKRFRKRFNLEPETYAAHGFDGMEMLLWSIQLAGLNRAKIRDVLAFRREPWPGVTGDIVWSAAHDDLGEVYLARREKGLWKYYSRADLAIPEGPAHPRNRAVQVQAEEQVSRASQ